MMTMILVSGVIYAVYCLVVGMAVLAVGDIASWAAGKWQARARRSA